MEKILNDRSGKSDLITKAMEELNKAFPTLKRVIIEERDAFMVAKLRQTAEALIHNSSDDQKPKVIVAIVGAGHCSGMLEKLIQIDDRKSPEKILSSIVETKKRKVQNDEEVSSLVTDICQFDYSCILEGTMLT
jgi:pheromone shutdown protein TraB